MNTNHPASGKPKRPYRKPEFVEVALRPEEAVLGACKNSNKNGPGGGCGPAAVGCKNSKS